MRLEAGDYVLPVDKPAGPTSHDVVSAARRALGTRRVGHTGTLDPFASGLLLLCVGEAQIDAAPLGSPPGAGVRRLADVKRMRAGRIDMNVQIRRVHVDIGAKGTFGGRRPANIAHANEKYAIVRLDFRHVLIFPEFF